MKTEIYTVKYSIETETDIMTETIELEARTYEEAFLAIQNTLGSIKSNYKRLKIECETKILSVFPQKYTIAKQDFSLKTLENTKVDLNTIESILHIEGEVEHLGLLTSQQAISEACDRVIEDCMQIKDGYKYYIDRIKDGQSFQK